MISTYEPRLCVTTEHGKIFGETDSKTLLKSPFIDLYDVARNLAWKGLNSDSQRAVAVVAWTYRHTCHDFYLTSYRPTI